MIDVPQGEEQLGRRIEPRADAWFDPSVSSREQRWRETDVSDAHLRDYLAATLDTTLELLDKAGETDAALHLFRLALFCEDRVAEMLAALSHAAGIAGAAVKELWPIWPSRVRREPLWFGAQRWLRDVADPAALRARVAALGGHVTLFRAGEPSSGLPRFQPCRRPCWRCICD